MSSDRRMAGSDADTEASEAEYPGGESLRPPPLLSPAATPLSESALCPAAAAAAAGVALGKGTVSDTRQLPEPSHAGSTLAALSRLRVHAVLCVLTDNADNEAIRTTQSSITRSPSAGIKIMLGKTPGIRTRIRAPSDETSAQLRCKHDDGGFMSAFITQIAHLWRVIKRADVLPPRPCRLCTASCSESLLLLDSSDGLFSTMSCSRRSRGN